MGDFTDLLGQPNEVLPDPLATPATQPPQRKSQFQSLIDGPSEQDLRLGINLNGAASTTPDAHAKAMDIGGTIGAPADSVAANLKETEHLAKLQRYREALTDAPKMSKLLAEDPDIAKLAADEIELLSKNESTFGKILSAFYGGSPEAGSRLADIGRALPAGGLEGTGIAMEGVAALNDVIGRTAARGYRAVGLDALGDLADPATRPWWLNPSAIFGAGGTELRDVGKAVGPDEDRQNLATDIAGGVGQVAAQIATVLLTGGAASTASMFAQGAGILAERVEEQGKTGTAEGDAAIVMGASVTALTEKLGLDALLHRVPPAIRNGILRTLVDIGIGGGIEAVQEVTEGILHNLIALVTIDPNAKLLEGVEQDAKAAGGTGAVIRALVNAATKGRQISSNVQKQQRAGQDAATVEALVKGTADSKLRERNPDAFSAVMAAQTQGTPVEMFYVPAERIAELYQTGGPVVDGVDPLDQIEGLREQIAEAVAVGGDVEISAADYLTHIAPTPLHGALKNDLRASRDGWSVNQAKEFAENPEREAEVAALVERQADAATAAAPGQAVFDQAYADLMDTGRYTSAQAAEKATLTRERFVSRSQRVFGGTVSPEDLYKESRLQILGPTEAGDVAPAGALSQDEGFTVDAFHGDGRAGDGGAGQGQAGQGIELLQSVFHGSPHIFDRFSTAAIGTGEGAQVYGFGLYFAGKKEIAQYYRETLAGPQMTWDGEPVTARNIDAVEAEVVKALGEEGRRLTMYLWGAGSVAELRRKFPELEISAKAEKYLNKHLKSSPGGRLYTVEIPDDGEYLLHDKPLSEQPQAVRKAVEQVLDDYDIPGIADDYTGQDVYRAMENWAAATTAEGIRHNPSQTVSELLLAAGVRGIKYLDASARDSSGDSFNYVVFADADVVIQSYEQAAAGGPRGSYQRVRDPYGNLSNVIRLTEGANLSTALHEFGHFFLFQLIDDATLPGATAEARVKLQADLQTALDHLGIKVDVATSTADQIHAAMTREAHELWARSFEVYAREGKAPSAALRDAFASFASWLVRIYKSLKTIPDYTKRLTPEVRGVMDRLLATDEAIADAQASASFRVPAALRTVMTTAEQRSLERLTEEATHEARAELQRRVMAELARERLEWWKAERARVRGEVETEVRNRPSYRAYNLLRHGETPDGDAVLDSDGNPTKPKLDKAGLTQAYGKDVLKQLPKGVAAQSGVNHEVFAGLVGFSSGDELRDALTSLQPMKATIDAETDARMKAKHGDMLTDGRLQADAAEIVLNQKQVELAALQAKVLERLAAGIEKKASTKAAGGKREAVRQVRRLQTGLDAQAIAAAAKKAIAGKRLEDAVPAKYRAQADRLGREVEVAIAKQDYELAAKLKEQQVVNLALAREAQEVQAQVTKALKRFGRLNKPDAKLAKAQNIDFVGAVRAILSRFGLSRPQAGFDQQVWYQRLQEDNPAGAVDMRDMIDAATANAGTVAARGRTRTRAKAGGAPRGMGEIWRQMTVTEFQALSETIDAILHMGRADRTAELDGERVEMKQVIDDLNAQASSRNTGKRPGQTSKATDAEKIARRFQGLAASLERVETWARRMDDGKPNGPYTRTFVKPILAVIYQYREARQDKLTRLLAIIEPRKGDLLGKKIHSNELDYTFDNKAELLHAILHTGNESNMRKLLLGGRGEGFAWGKRMPDGAVDTSRWDSMIRRLVAEGVITKADYDTAQQIWDLFEETKGPAQVAFHKMKGYYFKEVEVTGIQTPFGRYKGGYAPAIAEGSLVAESGSNIDADAMGQLANAGVLPGVGAGFTKSRVENYTKPLELNLMKLPGHLDSVLKLTYLGPAVRQAARIARHREFRDHMFAVDPNAIDNMLVPWLHRVARQTSEIPYTQDAERTAGKALGWLRKTTGLQAMAGNILNAAQQITGLSSGMVRVRPTAVLRGLVASVKAPNATTAMITQKSAFMRDRMANTTHDLMANLEDLLVDKWKVTKLSEKAQKHGYFAQVIAQNFVDKALWLGAHERAIAKGMTDAEAVLEADSVIRTTQGSFNPEDASNAEARAALGKLFLMFYSYFNTQYNLLRSEAEIAVRESGWVGASPRLFAIYIMGVMIPAVMAEAIIQAARGELGDDDDDGLLDDIGELFGLSQIKFFAAMVPFAGSFVNFVINLSNDKPYDDRLSFAPVFGNIERLITGGANVYKYATSDDGSASRAIKDALNILGTALGLPLGQLGKPAGYIADVLTGEQEGETIGDWIRGTLSGREAPRQ